MKTLYFNRQTLKGSLSRFSNADIAIEVDDDCYNVKKTISEYDKDIQKVNENGEPLYLKNVYETVTKETILGYEKTTEVTDTPCIETVWKTNKDGFKLYHQKMYNEDGEVLSEYKEVTNHMQVFSYKEEYYYETTDIVIGQDEEGNNIYKQIKHTYEVPDEYEYNEPIYIDVHIEDEEGNKLYLKPIKETWEEEIISETVETTDKIQVFSYKKEEVTKTISVMVSECNHVCDETCEGECKHDCDEFCEPVFEEKQVTEVVQVPDEFEENEPIMIPVYKEVEVDIFSRPEEFEISDVLLVKYEQDLAETKYNYILADMFINDEDIDFDYEEHAANTGAFVCCIHPQGKVQLKELALEAPARIFELLNSEIPEGINIYINDYKLNNNKVMLPTNTETCVIRFENTTDKYLDVRSYCIAY